MIDLGRADPDRSAAREPEGPQRRGTGADPAAHGAGDRSGLSLGMGFIDREPGSRAGVNQSARDPAARECASSPARVKPEASVPGDASILNVGSLPGWGAADARRDFGAAIRRPLARPFRFRDRGTISLKTRRFSRAEPLSP